MTGEIAMRLRQWGGEIDRFLRTGKRLRNGRDQTGLSGWRAWLLIVLGGALYGAIMSTFSYDSERAILIMYGAIKVPVLFSITMLLAVPGFYVLNALRGLSDDFARVFSILIDYQLLVVAVLVALSPVTVFINLGTADAGYGLVQLWNTMVFLAGALLAQWKFSCRYRQLIARDARHRLLMRVWTILYAFIGVQMAWTLRPFIGAPKAAAVLIRDSCMDNAYVEILRLFIRTLWDDSGP